MRWPPLPARQMRHRGPGAPQGPRPGSPRPARCARRPRRWSGPRRRARAAPPAGRRGAPRGPEARTGCRRAWPGRGSRSRRRPGRRCQRLHRVLEIGQLRGRADDGAPVLAADAVEPRAADQQRSLRRQAAVRDVGHHDRPAGHDCDTVAVAERVDGFLARPWGDHFRRVHGSPPTPGTTGTSVLLPEPRPARHRLSVIVMPRGRARDGRIRVHTRRSSSSPPLSPTSSPGCCEPDAPVTFARGRGNR